MQTPHRLSLLIVLIAALFATTASAQPSPPDEAARRARASELYLRGRGHFERGEFEAALRDISESYQVFPLPAVLYNIATAQRRLGDLDGAIRNFERYLRDSGEALPPERRSEVEGALSELRGATIEVRFVLVAPAGATPRVTVDGRPLADEAPSRAFRFAPGPHDFEATASGMVTARERRVLSAGALVTVSLRLAPPEATTGVVRLAVTAPSPRVFVDAISRPQWRDGLVLERGPHRVRVEADEHRPFADTILVRAGETLTIPVSLPQIARGFFERPAGWAVIIVGVVAVSVGVSVGVAAAFPTVVPQQQSRGATLCLESSPASACRLY